MNEELNIIIRAVTDTATKNINKVKKELGAMSKEGSKGAGIMSKAFKGIGIAAGVAVGAITAVTGALVALGNSTRDFQKEQAKLNTAFQAAGASTEQAAKTYNDLFRFLGDSGKATEAAGHLAKLSTEEKALAEWTTSLQGVYATFGDSLPIESLTEAANETARVGTVTGAMADALNWAGVSEDAFNAQLAQTTSLSEREALIRNTLNGLYSDAAQIYEKNNADLIANNEAQARLDATTGKLGRTIMPLLTALSNLSNTLLVALGPAITWVSNVLTVFINAISKAVSWVMTFIKALGGSSKSADNTKQLAQAVSGVSGGLSGASSGAGALSNNLTSATKEAEKLKRATAGFDELNVMSSNSTAATSASAPSGGGAGGSGGGLGLSGGGIALDTGGLTESLDGVSEKMSAFVDGLKSKVAKLKDIFAPTTKAWGKAFKTIQNSWNDALPDFKSGIEEIKQGFTNVSTYVLGEFVPSIVNSFSTNIAPVIGDVFGFALEQAGETFAWFGGMINSISTEIINPAFETIHTVVTDVFSAIGEAWEQYGAPLMYELDVFFTGIRQMIEDFYNGVILPIWDKLKEVFDKLWKESLEPLVKDIVEAAMEIGTNLLSLYNNFIKPIVDWILSIIYPIIAEVVGKVIEIVGNIVGKISEVIRNIIGIIRGLVEFVSGVFTGDWNKAWNGIKNTFSSLTGFFKSVWEAIKSVFSGVATFFKTTFESAWKAVKRVFTSGGKVFEGIKEGILKVFKTIVNGLIKGINNVVKLPFQGLNGILNTIYSLEIAGIKPFSWLTWRAPIPQIPLLAKGGIINSATMAVVGERGKEAVLPLENNTGWMDMLADRIASRNSAPSKIVLMVGERELGYAAIDSINGITKQTGNLQLVLV